MRLKRTIVAMTTVFAAVLGLSGCGSDSGSSVAQRDVEGIWSFYEEDPNAPLTAAQDLYTPLKPGLALAYDGNRNRPRTLRGTQNFFLQLTNETQVAQACDTCGQSVSGNRLYGKSLSLNQDFLCTPDILNNNNASSVPTRSWLQFYGTLDGTTVQGKMTGKFSKSLCSTNENGGPDLPPDTNNPGPNNCANAGLSGSFDFPIEIDVSGELQWEEWDLAPVFAPGEGFCKMVLTMEKKARQNQVNGAMPPVDPLTGDGYCTETRQIELFKSGYQPTDRNSENCGPFENTSGNRTPPVMPATTVTWSTNPNFGGCSNRDAYRWGPILMLESECLDTYYSQ